MGRKVGSEKISREDGYLYFIGKDGYVWRAPMKAKRGGSKKRVGAEKISKRKGYMYYVGKDGCVYEARMKNVPA
jgi:hypothetical protein